MAANQRHRDKTLRLWSSIFVVLMLILGLQPVSLVKAQQPTYDTAFLTDAELEDYTSMSEADIRAFLHQMNSYFQQTVEDVDGQLFDTANVIFQAAQRYRINPKVILTTLQKEHSGVTTSSRPSDIGMANLMGCGTPSTAREQLTCTAERFRAYQDRLITSGASPSGWQVGVAKNTQDGVSVTPATNAVAGQFTYTPYAGKEWGGNRPDVGGVYLFYYIWNNFGFGSTQVPPANPPSPPGDLHVGIQAGHYNGRGGACSCDGTVCEQVITFSVAQQTIQLLQQAGIQADFLEGREDAVSGYIGNAFVALHTDFCAQGVSGFKVSRWGGVRGTGLDGSGDASDQLVTSLWDEYENETGLQRESSPGRFTDDMIWYYGLNPLGGIDPLTPGAIIEMGWLSEDLAFMNSTDGQAKMAQGIANAIFRFLNIPTPGSHGGDTATILVMDVSGSMGNYWQGGIKMDSAKSAANQIINMLDQDSQAGGSAHRLGVVSFTTDAYQNQSLTSDFNQARTAIASLMHSNSTNIGAGLGVANDTLAGASLSEEKIIILLSDGMTNVGLTPEEILAGPVQDAVRAGTCIYTVGFGDSGDIDEDLLKEIARASGCGEYYYATDLSQLENIYIMIRHQSTGNILAELTGIVAQGQTVQAGTVVVPVNQDQIAVSLHWPGSKMQLILHDPSGAVLDQNSPYVKLTTYANMVYALIINPMPGSWVVDVFGEDIPQTSEAFTVVVSGRAGVTPLPTSIPTSIPTSTPRPVPPLSGGGGFPVALLILVLGGCGVAVYVYAQVLQRRKSPLGNVSNADSFASLTVLSGLRAGQVIKLGGDSITIGRSASNQIKLPDQAVSRNHAILRCSQGNWFIQDQNSQAGILVNEIAIDATRLKNGDRIQIGTTVFLYTTR